MAMQGRKNVHGKTGVRFKAAYTASKRKSMLRNVVSSLIVNGQVKVTSGVTQDLVTLASKLVSFAKKGDVAARREAAKYVKGGFLNKDGKEALKVLFEEIGPRFKERDGGYTQVFKLGARKGDNAEVELVRWSE